MRITDERVGEVYTNPKYGDCKIVEYVEHRNNVAFYRVIFKESGYETVASIKDIRKNNVKDKYYIPKDLKDKVFTNNYGRKYKVVSKDITKRGHFIVEFIDTHTQISRTRKEIIGGKITDKLSNRLGIVDSDIYNYVNGKKTYKHSYQLYNSIIYRQKRKGSTVCDEWKESFINFRSWLENVELPKHNVTLKEFDAYEKLQGYDLDKDFECIGNKLYSPELCHLIPHEFNMSLRNLDNVHFFLTKDGEKIEITNLREFLMSLGYEIKQPKQKILESSESNANKK